ncbi:MAG: hypothetical protein HQK83_08760 [Fibrobacteria bacterium]|nr:hypothetical protein [Fibrobacteria bacterium]
MQHGNRHINIVKALILLMIPALLFSQSIQIEQEPVIRLTKQEKGQDPALENQTINREIKGQVLFIDSLSFKIIIKTKAGIDTLQVAKETVIYRGIRKVTIRDITKNKVLSARYRIKDNVKLVHKIIITK